MAVPKSGARGSDTLLLFNRQSGLPLAADAKNLYRKVCVEERILISCTLPGEDERCRRKTGTCTYFGKSAPLIWLTRQGVLEAMGGGHIKGPANLQLMHDVERLEIEYALARMRLLICGPGTRSLSRLDHMRIITETTASEWLTTGDDPVQIALDSPENIIDESLPDGDSSEQVPRRRTQTKMDVRHLEANLTLFLNLLGCFTNFLTAGRSCVAKTINFESLRARVSNPIFSRIVGVPTNEVPFDEHDEPSTLENFSIRIHQIWCQMLGRDSTSESSQESSIWRIMDVFFLCGSGCEFDTSQRQNRNWARHCLEMIMRCRYPQMRGILGRPLRGFGRLLSVPHHFLDTLYIQCGAGSSKRQGAAYVKRQVSDFYMWVMGKIIEAYTQGIPLLISIDNYVRTMKTNRTVSEHGSFQIGDYCTVIITLLFSSYVAVGAVKYSILFGKLALQLNRKYTGCVRCSKDAVFQNVLSCLNCDSKGPPVPCAGGAKLVFDRLNASKRLKTEAGVTFLNPYAQQERIHNGWSCPAEIWATGLNTGTKFLTDLFYENFEASQVNSTHDPNLVCRCSPSLAVAPCSGFRHGSDSHPIFVGFQNFQDLLAHFLQSFGRHGALKFIFSDWLCVTARNWSARVQKASRSVEFDAYWTHDAFVPEYGTQSRWLRELVCQIQIGKNDSCHLISFDSLQDRRA